MECNICGGKDDLVKVLNEDGETIYLCEACHEAQYEGFEASSASDLTENQSELLDDDLQVDEEADDEDSFEAEDEEIK